MNYFSIFFRQYCRQEYGRLWLAVCTTVMAVFGRNNPDSWNQYIVFDHGMLLRLLRDIFLLVGLVCRLVFGFVTIVTVLLLLPILAILRALVIPLAAAFKGIGVSRKTKEHMNARSQ